MIYLKNDDILLFQGDSITHGGRVQSDWDMNHIIGHGYQDYVAQTLGLYNIERDPTIINRGVSGDSVFGLTARIKEDMLDIKPTIMSLLAGANDSTVWLNGNKEHTPERAIKMYREVLERLKEVCPDVKLILGQPFRIVPVDSKDPLHDQSGVDYVKDIAALWEETARDYNAIFVKFADALEPYLESCAPKQIIWDYVHPTYVGHAILAKCWLETVERGWRY